ncbi:MAG: hypothetical protein FWF92_02530 [Oscillospiraceae bacterium]|nr:hypothetical protein [Oscillospiraceae bacterium]
MAYNNKLPDYYITKKVAENDYKWNPRKNTIGGKAPGKMIGGDVYDNGNGHLPDAPGRTWYEADINYMGRKRNTERVVYSNDGLIFVTYDHFDTFIEIIKKTSDTNEEEEE